MRLDAVTDSYLMTADELQTTTGDTSVHLCSRCHLVVGIISHVLYCNHQCHCQLQRVTFLTVCYRTVIVRNLVFAAFVAYRFWRSLSAINSRRRRRRFPHRQRGPLWGSSSPLRRFKPARGYPIKLANTWSLADQLVMNIWLSIASWILSE